MNIQDLLLPSACRTGRGYYDAGTPASGSDVPLSDADAVFRVNQRVGGRAGTAAPKGTVCELPNPDYSHNFWPLPNGRLKSNGQATSANGRRPGTGSASIGCTMRQPSLRVSVS